MISKKVEKALIEIKNFCAKKQCGDCPLFIWKDDEFKECFLDSRPDLWRLDLLGGEKYEQV